MLADTFIANIGAMEETAPARAREMAQLVVDHRDKFTHADSYWVKSALVAPVPKTSGGPGHHNGSLGACSAKRGEGP